MRLARAGTAAALAALIAACGTARKVEETSAINDCARCHGFPPPEPHPQSTACYTCHATTVGPGNVLIPGGTHMNGKVDVSAHAAPFPPSQHGPAADAGIDACTMCHGADYAGGATGASCNGCHAGSGYADWKTNCTFCHGTRTQGWTEASLTLAAPPQSVDGAGDQTSANPKVGAHQAHLANTAYVNPLPCTSCHGVPVREFPGSLVHVDGQPVTPAFSGLATQGVVGAAYAGNGGSCAVYCHGAGTAFANPGATPSATVSPPWTATSIACDGCHGTPPTTGQHGFTNHQFPCGYCHPDAAITSPPAIANKALHVNGQKDVAFTVSGSFDATAKSCSNVLCHTTQDTRSWYPAP